MRTLALLAAAIMTLSLFAAVVVAKDDECSSDQESQDLISPLSGRKEIHTLEDLDNIRNDLLGRYILMNDIDASPTSDPESDFWNDGKGWEPIGDTDVRFRGRLDGNGHTISNLFINRPSTENVGLFGAVEGDGQDYFHHFTNLGMVDVNISGDSRVGSIIGISYNYIIISDSYATGKVSGHIAGGLVGRLSSFNEIKRCYANVDVSGSGTVGGLVGNAALATIRESYAIGNVSGNAWVGGLVGGYGYIIESYAIGNVSGNTDVGGLVGFGSSASNSFWDIEATGQTESGSGVGKTTDEMMRISTFMNWDFEEVWCIIEGVTYPILRHSMTYTVESIFIERQPDLSYDYGDELDLNLLKVNMTWSDGPFIKNSTVGHKDFGLHGLEAYPADGTVLDHSHDGSNVTVTHIESGENAHTEEMTIDRIVIEVRIHQTPDKTVYSYGDALDLSGLEVNLTWSDTGNETVGMDGFADNVSTDPPQGHELKHEYDEVTVVHSASGETAVFAITIEGIVTDMRIQQQPQLEYHYGDELNLSSIKVAITWSDAGDQIVDFADFDANGLELDHEIIGPIHHGHEGKNITVTHASSGESAFTENITVKRIVKALWAYQEPMLVYSYSDPLDLELLRVNLTWSDTGNETVAFSEFGVNITTNIEDGKTLSHEDTTLTVTHAPSGESAHFDITVNRIVTGIGVSVKPHLFHLEGSRLDLGPMEVKLEYSNGDNYTYAWTPGGNLSVSPGHNTVLTLAHHGLAVEVTHIPSGYSYSIESLFLVAIPFDEQPAEDEDIDDYICPLPVALMLVLGMSGIALRRK